MKKCIASMTILITVVVCISVVIVMGRDQRPSVTVQPCKVEDVSRMLACSGSLIAERQKSICLTSLGLVRSVQAHVGDRVEAGQVLFTVTDVSQIAEYGLEQFVGSALANSDLIQAMLEGRDVRSVFGDLTVSQTTDVFSSDDVIAYTAPIGGTVTAVNVVENGIAVPGIACVTVTDEDSLYVLADVAENDVYKLKIGQQAVITVRGANEKIKGEITSLPTSVRSDGNILSPGEQIGTATIRLSGTCHGLPGMSCSVRIVTSTVKNALTVPFDALHRDSDGDYYLYVTDGDTVHKMPVIYGIDWEGRVQVITESGKPFYYVADPDMDWQDGIKVRVQLVKES